MVTSMAASAAREQVICALVDVGDAAGRFRCHA
jgi:hypothetical protein